MKTSMRGIVLVSLFSALMMSSLDALSVCPGNGASVCVGFVVSNGQTSEITYPGADRTVVHGINDQGHLVGYYFHGSNWPSGFLYSDGNFTSIDYPTALETDAYGINNSDEVVGAHYAHPRYDGFDYLGGIFLQGSLYFSATGINDFGQSVGWQYENGWKGFLYDHGVTTTFQYPGGRDTFAQSINDAGAIVGYYLSNGTSGNDRGFSYSGGSFTTIDYPGASNTMIFGIAKDGTLVGSYDGPDGVHGFLDVAGQFIKFDYAECAPGDQCDTWLYGVSDAGFVGEYYVFSGSTTPEPASIVLLCSGVLAVGYRARNRFGGRLGRSH